MSTPHPMGMPMQYTYTLVVYIAGSGNSGPTIITNEFSTEQAATEMAMFIQMLNSNTRWTVIKDQS